MHGRVPPTTRRREAASAAKQPARGRAGSFTARRGGREIARVIKEGGACRFRSGEQGTRSRAQAQARTRTDSAAREENSDPATPRAIVSSRLLTMPSLVLRQFFRLLLYLRKGCVGGVRWRRAPRPPSLFTAASPQPPQQQPSLNRAPGLHTRPLRQRAVSARIHGQQLLNAQRLVAAAGAGGEGCRAAVAAATREARQRRQQQPKHGARRTEWRRENSGGSIRGKRGLSLASAWWVQKQKTTRKV